MGPKKATPSSDLNFKSPAEFFAENRQIAGFDNPGKCLYTTIRELVENSLDACESISVLPDIEITIQQYTKKQLNEMMGVDSIERQDETLYNDYETSKEKLKREERERKAERRASLSGGGSFKKDGGSGKRVKEELFYRVTVRDNGCGIPHDKIPNLLGRVLCGTKYKLQQSRGRFGLGAKMALIWSKQSTGLPVTIKSSRSETAPVSHCRLDIDIHKNEPRILEHDKTNNNGDFGRGTSLEVVIGGQWVSYKARIITYLRQLAVITPHARFLFRFEAGSSGARRGSKAAQGADDGTPTTPGSSSSSSTDVVMEFARRSDQVPAPAKAVKHHPSAVDVLLMRQLINGTRYETLLKFLCNEFNCIDKAMGGRLLNELGGKFDAETSVKALSDNATVKLVQLLKSIKFKPPSGDCLSGLGEYNLRLGIIKEHQPELIATYKDKACVCEGHPFLIEAAVCWGGKLAKPGVEVFRFANRIPLLFEPGADVSTKCANNITWSSYKMNQATDKIGVFVSIVSTKVPFKGTGKEYIGYDIVEIRKSVTRSIQNCCNQLKSKLAKRASAKDLKTRKKNLKQYIPNVSRSLVSVLDKVPPDDADNVGDGDVALTDILQRVQNGEIDVSTLQQALDKYIDSTEATSVLDDGDGKSKATLAKIHIMPRSRWFDSSGDDGQPPSKMIKLASPAEDTRKMSFCFPATLLVRPIKRE